MKLDNFMDHLAATLSAIGLRDMERE